MDVINTNIVSQPTTTTAVAPSISGTFLAWISGFWKAPPGIRRQQNWPKDPEGHAMMYATQQFNGKAQIGIGYPVLGCEVLEIGCGHGGISCFLANAGAKKVVGIDVNKKHLEFAENFKKSLSEKLGPNRELPVEFVEMNAYQMNFKPNSFDMVYADNAFEHFEDPEEVMKQSFKVLREGGELVVPIFSSIYSKYGLHLKNGLKMPWANLFFSEKTIINAMQRLAQKRPELYKNYPGLARNPTKVRELRAYNDLNDITYRSFREMAKRTGFKIKEFRVHKTPSGQIFGKVPGLKNSFLMDILSTGAFSVLKKPMSSN